MWHHPISACIYSSRHFVWVERGVMMITLNIFPGVPFQHFRSYMRRKGEPFESLKCQSCWWKSNEQIRPVCFPRRMQLLAGLFQPGCANIHIHHIFDHHNSGIDIPENKWKLQRHFLNGWVSMRNFPGISCEVCLPFPLKSFWKALLFDGRNPANHPKCMRLRR